MQAVASGICTTWVHYVEDIWWGWAQNEDNSTILGLSSNILSQCASNFGLTHTPYPETVQFRIRFSQIFTRSQPCHKVRRSPYFLRQLTWSLSLESTAEYDEATQSLSLVPDVYLQHSKVNQDARTCSVLRILKASHENILRLRWVHIIHEAIRELKTKYSWRVPPHREAHTSILAYSQSI
jgi:hypothetical protein